MKVQKFAGCIATFVATTLFIGVLSSDTGGYSQYDSRVQQIIEENLHQFEFIGQYGDKLFFKNGTLSTWQGSKYRCFGSSMQLAEFRNLSEYNFVTRQDNAPIDHWIGARMIGIDVSELARGAFQWEDAKITMDNTPYFPFYHSDSQYLCLWTDDVHVHVDFCQRPHFTLCQAIL